MGLFSRFKSPAAAPVSIGAPVIAPATIERTTTIGQILRSPAMYEELFNAAKAEMAEENLIFVTVIAHYRALTTRQIFNLPVKAVQAGAWIPPERRAGCNTMGKYIYDTYVANGAPVWVNLPGSIAGKLATIAQSKGYPFLPTDYDAAFDNIAALIDVNTKTRILTSR